MNESRPFAQRTARQTLLDSLTNPAKLRQSLKISGLTGGLPTPIARLLAGDPEGPVSNFAMPKPSETVPLPSVMRAHGARRARVGMLTGCVMRVLYDDVNADTAAVLVANGCEVLVNQSQGCCGALHGHNGFRKTSVELAKKLIDSFSPFDGLEAIIVNSAGCGSSMKEYGELLADDSGYAKKAAAFSEKCKDVSEFLNTLGWIGPLKSLPIRITYHDACHLAHAQGIKDSPRQLLEKIPELEIVPLNEAEVCCGSAGIYNLTEPAMARRLQERKVQNIIETGAKAVVTGNPGCMAWIAGGLTEHDVPVLHPVSVLRASLTVDPLFTSEH